MAQRASEGRGGGLEPREGLGHAATASGVGAGDGQVWGRPAPTSGSAVPWPAVADPAGLLGEITDWLHGYGNRGTRRTYAEGLGLPVSPTDLHDWLLAPGADRTWADALARYAAVMGVTTTAAARMPTTPPEPAHGAGEQGRPAGGRGTRRPPPAARGRLRQVHWFRWCVARGLDPVDATATDVKAWLDALADAGAAPATRDRMLGALKALYGWLAESGLVAGNPAALNRRRLGLAGGGRASSTVTLTTAQVAQLYRVAGERRPGVGELGAARARAVVALFTLGLRVSELCHLDRADLHVTRGRRALRVPGKGDKPRIVYLSALADDALTAYLRIRDSAAGTTVARGSGRPSGSTPLVATAGGGRCTRQGVWHLLRRLAGSTDGPLAQVADDLHPHALRHFYVTTAVEAGAQLVHVQADVGHTSVDTTNQVYNAAARDPSRSAVDLVADAISPPTS